MKLREASLPLNPYDPVSGYAPSGRANYLPGPDQNAGHTALPLDDLAFSELPDEAEEEAQDWSGLDLLQLYSSLFDPTTAPTSNSPFPASGSLPQQPTGRGLNGRPSGQAATQVTAKPAPGNPPVSSGPQPGNTPVSSGPQPSNTPVSSRPQPSNTPVGSRPEASNRPRVGPGPDRQSPAATTSSSGTNPGPTNPTRVSPNTLNLPPRPEGAMTGREFMDRTRNLSRDQREALILQEIQKGNVPEFARQMREIQFQHKGHSATLRVMPDYLAIGSDQDFVRIPMDPRTAQKIADQTGTSLPTPKMVDEIYRQADNRLTPQPLPAGAQMMSNDYYQRHNQKIEEQMSQKGAPHGQLTAGHKKDLVISNRLTQHPDRVAIYGWHQPNGKAIQPLSTLHESSYADYSHGVRLVGGSMLVDGVERPVAEVLRDPALAGLISNEGALTDPRVPGV